MPSTNSIKEYVESGIYHVYNRGVNRQNVFFDKKDYATFLNLLDHYLMPPPANEIRQKTANFHGKINLLTFSLIPNHLHTILQQVGRCDMEGFMRSLMISYTARINKKYERVGHLFQDSYKARSLKGNDDLVNTSFYVHYNPKKELGLDPFEYSYSSIKNYTESTKNGFVFVKENIILDLFESRESYTEGFKNYIEEMEKREESSQKAPSWEPSVQKAPGQETS